MDGHHHDAHGMAKSKSISQLHFNAINNAASSKHKYATGSSGGTPDETRKLLSNQKKFIITPASPVSRRAAATTSGSSGSASSSSATSPQPHSVSKNAVRSRAYANDSGSSSGLESIRPQRPSRETAPLTTGQTHLAHRTHHHHTNSPPSTSSSPTSPSLAVHQQGTAQSSPAVVAAAATTSTASLAMSAPTHHGPSGGPSASPNHNNNSFYSGPAHSSTGAIQMNNHQLANNAKPFPRTGSYIFSDCGSSKMFSDAASMRSIASIGMGSTDGKKMVIRRVPTSPTELLTIINQPGPIDHDGDDGDSFDGLSEDSDTAHLKPRRQHWASKMQFVLACIGYSVGLGNVWRFPYLCYKSGGGVFLIPYFIILVVCGIPMLFMELAVGQYTGRGPIGAIGQLCPLFKGAGLASVVISFLMSTYYSVIIAYAIYYFFTSFRPEMPWVDCSARWTTPDCWIPERSNANMTRPTNSRTPSEEFFENKVLQISNGLENPGGMRWELVACLVCAWILVYFAIWKSIKSSAKVRYVTATLPFVLIVVFLGRALTLDGAELGLRYFFKPNWALLKNANVWINAASQNFNSLGIAFGSMISFASYNKYNNNFLHDVLAVSFVNAITSLLVGIFAFATLGNIAWEQGASVEAVISDGPGFIFIVYPQAMAKMPAGQMWAVLFFFMLLCLGLNSQFAIVEVVVTSIQDGFPNWIKKKLVYHELLVLIVCVVSFFFGLPNLIQGGIYFFQLIDHYAASVSIMFLAFFQMIAIGWFYGVRRLSKNIKQMTGKSPSLYFRSCWLIVGPLLLICLWIFSLINYEPPTYHNGKYSYPPWAHGIGWSITAISLICIPAYAIVNIVRAEGNSFWEKLKSTCRPNIYECKICGEHHCEHEFPDEVSVTRELTPIMAVSPNNLASHMQQQQHASQSYPNHIVLKPPPSGHPHKNGGSAKPNGSHTTQPSNNETAMPANETYSRS